jgi:hypothetical protein
MEDSGENATDSCALQSSNSLWFWIRVPSLNESGKEKGDIRNPEKKRKKNEILAFLWLSSKVLALPCFTSYHLVEYVKAGALKSDGRTVATGDSKSKPRLLFRGLLFFLTS